MVLCKIVIHDIKDLDGRPGTKLKSKVAKLLTQLTNDKPDVPGYWHAASVWQIAYGTNVGILQTKYCMLHALKTENPDWATNIEHLNQVRTISSSSSSSPSY